MKIQFIKETTIVIHADYGNGNKQKHLVDYFPKEKLELSSILREDQNGIKGILMDGDIVLVKAGTYKHEDSKSGGKG